MEHGDGVGGSGAWGWGVGRAETSSGALQFEVIDPSQHLGNATVSTSLSKLH